MGTVIWIVAVETHTPSSQGPSPLDFDVPLSTRGVRAAEALINKDDTRLVMNVSVARASPQREKIEALSSRLLNPGTALRADAGALKQSLTLIKDQAAERLILCWIGHGVMHDGKRYVLHEESIDADTLSSFEVESLLQRLRTEDFPPVQIGFFDTCAQFVSERPGNEQLPRGPATVRGQYFYFACGAGALTSAALDRPGLTDYALDVLLECPWPPEPLTLESILWPRLLKVKDGSFPSRLERTQGSGESWSSHGPEEASSKASILELASQASGLSGRLFDYLFQTVDSLGISPNELSKAIRSGNLDQFTEAMRIQFPDNPQQQLFKDAWTLINMIRPWADRASTLGLLMSDWYGIAHTTADEDLRIVAPFAELKELLLWAADFPKDTDRGLRSLLRILLRGHRRAAQVGKPERVLAAYLDALKHDELFSPWIDSMQAELPLPEDRVILLAELQLLAGVKEPQLTNVWIDSGAGITRWSFEPSKLGLGENLNVLTDALQTHFNRPLRVEILAPLDALCGPREWLSYIIDDLAVGSREPLRIWLDEMLPISWRWKERLEGQNAKLQPGLWDTRAREVRISALNAKTLRCFFDEPSHVGSGASDSHVRILAYVPPGPGDLKRNRLPFIKALLSGDPYMIWPRALRDDKAQFLARIKQWLQGKRLSEFSCSQRCDDVLEDIIIFIDEAERNPYRHGRYRA